MVGRFVGKEALAAVGGSVTQIVNLIVGFFCRTFLRSSWGDLSFTGQRTKKSQEKSAYGVRLFCDRGHDHRRSRHCHFRPALKVMQTPGEIVEQSKIYLYIYFAGMVFNLIYNMGSSILRAVGGFQTAAVCAYHHLCPEHHPDIVLVVFFHMGIAGAAIATVFSQAVSAVIVTWMLMKTGEIYRLQLRQMNCAPWSPWDDASHRCACRYGVGDVQYFQSGDPGICQPSGDGYRGGLGNLCKDRCGVLDGDQRFRHCDHHLCGTELRRRQKDRMRKSVRVCMLMSFGSAIVFKCISHCFLQSRCTGFYHRHECHSHWHGDDVLSGTFLQPVCDHWDSFRSVARRGKGFDPHAPHLRRSLCTAHDLVFAVLPAYPGMETIMLSYPVSWGITAVLFILYYFKRFPKAESTKTGVYHEYFKYRAYQQNLWRQNHF